MGFGVSRQIGAEMKKSIWRSLDGYRQLAARLFFYLQAADKVEWIGSDP